MKFIDIRFKIATNWNYYLSDVGVLSKNNNNIIRKAYYSTLPFSSYNLCDTDFFFTCINGNDMVPQLEYYRILQNPAIFY